MFYLRLTRTAFVWLGWAAVCAIATTAVAGQQPDAKPAAPEYFIEFHIADGCLFAPISGAHRGYFAYALPRPAKYLPDSSGQPIISKIAVNAQQSGELWTVRVFVGAGEFYDAGDRQIATFTLRTNERAEVGEGARFGLSPFRVGVVKVFGQDVSKPRIIFKTQSLSVANLEANTLPEPYRLALKNNSDKDVLAIQYNTYKNQQLLHLKWLQLPHQALIKAGETYQLEVLSLDRTCADPDGYRPAQSNRIEIASVVFVDGSYEGDSGLAALVRGQALGNKKNLERVVATLNTLNGTAEANPELLLFDLKFLAEGMDEVADSNLVEALRNGLPPQADGSVPTLTNFIRSGQHEIHASVLSDGRQLEALIKSQNAEAIRKWCGKIILKYQEWLARVDALSAH